MTPAGELVVGVDGGGTRTTVAVATPAGAEVARRAGPAGLVDPRRPSASAHVVAELVRDALAEAGAAASPARAIVAGLAGVGNTAERAEVRAALEATGVAERVEVVPDGEIALEGALGGEAGILLVAGTGSVAYGRAEDGRIERAGGWGMWIGDEGSAFALARAGLIAAVRADDGRGPATTLLRTLLEETGARDAAELPPWVGRAEKGAVAALAAAVLREAAAGDGVAMELAHEQAAALAAHAVALCARLAPWRGAVPVVGHGGLFAGECYTSLVHAALARADTRFTPREPRADAVAGALRRALQLAAEPPATLTAATGAEP